MEGWRDGGREGGGREEGRKGVSEMYVWGYEANNL